jgi:hypothetical protein
VLEDIIAIIAECPQASGVLLLAARGRLRRYRSELQERYAGSPDGRARIECPQADLELGIQMEIGNRSNNLNKAAEVLRALITDPKFWVGLAISPLFVIWPDHAI